MFDILAGLARDQMMCPLFASKLFFMRWDWPYNIHSCLNASVETIQVYLVSVLQILLNNSYVHLLLCLTSRKLERSARKLVQCFAAGEHRT